MVKIVNCNLIKITILTIYPKDVKLFMRKVIRSMKYICFISKFYIELCEGSDTYMKKIYETIQEDILRKVQQGIYRPGDMLPSENQMAEMYSTSVPTVRRALADLVYEKVIYRIRGKGTFVCEEDDMEGEVPDLAEGEMHDTKICFLVRSNTSDSSVMRMLRGAQTYLFPKGYSINVMCSNDDSKDETKLAEECLRRGIEGVIWFSQKPKESIHGLKLFREHKIPVVMIDRGPAQIPYSLVSVYNTDGGYQMGKHLAELGHRRILFASCEFETAAEQDRALGYRMALEENGISYDPEFVLSDCLDNAHKVVRAVRELKATAVECVNDSIAFQVIRQLEKEGLRVPEDVSVTGFDNHAEMEYFRPRITTIHQPFEEMGKTAARKLLKMLKDNEPDSRVYLPGGVVMGESTCPPKKADIDKDM